MSPSSTALDPNGKYPQSFVFSITNTDSALMDMDITVDGNLKDYITIDSVDRPIPMGGTGKIRFTVDLPKDVKPGSYKGLINVISKNVVSGGGVGVRMAIAHVVWFDLPYQGEHIQPNLILRTRPINTLEVVAQAINDGTQTVPAAEITAVVYSPSGKVIKAVNGTKEVPVNSSAIVSGREDVQNPEEGEYRAVMTISYNGQTLTQEQNLTMVSAPPQQAAAMVPQATATIIGQASAGDNTILYLLAVIIAAIVLYVLLKRRR